jgi:hypothetical protein
LSSFAPTKDTTSSRVAALFDGFKGRRDSRSEASGAEWLSRKVSHFNLDSGLEPTEAGFQNHLSHGLSPRAENPGG